MCQRLTTKSSVNAIAERERLVDEKKTFRGHACAPDGLWQLNIKPDFVAKDLLSICDLWVLAR